jgi:hypothetical protein
MIFVARACMNVRTSTHTHTVTHTHTHTHKHTHTDRHTRTHHSPHLHAHCHETRPSHTPAVASDPLPDTQRRECVMQPSHEHVEHMGDEEPVSVTPCPAHTFSLLSSPLTTRWGISSQALKICVRCFFIHVRTRALLRSFSTLVSLSVGFSLLMLSMMRESRT